MIHRIPDDAPRRCKNLRPDQSDPYGVTRKRCQLNDGHDSKCVFEHTRAQPPGYEPAPHWKAYSSVK